MKIQLLEPFLRRRWVTMGCAVAVLGGGASLTVGGKTEQNASVATAPQGSLTAPVTAGPFLREVMERGEVRSSSNVEIRCQVPSRGSPGVAILQIVPEGAYVKEGDFLVRLDDSALQTDLLQQQISCNTSSSLLVDATADLE